MRISDWSSDVCSSDLFQRNRSQSQVLEASQSDQARVRHAGSTGGWVAREVLGEQWPLVNLLGVVPVVEFANRTTLKGDRQSVVEGKSVSFRVDLGGLSILKKKRSKAHKPQRYH